MARHAKTQQKRNLPPALTPEAAEAQMISLAMDCAKQQLIDGTASSQVITHFLKLGTQKHKAEMEKMSDAIDRAVDAAELIIASKTDEAMNKFN